jgi:predicted esterase YcpF (UPF0227 family)
MKQFVSAIVAAAAVLCGVVLGGAAVASAAPASESEVVVVEPDYFPYNVIVAAMDSFPDDSSHYYRDKSPEAKLTR